MLSLKSIGMMLVGMGLAVAATPAHAVMPAQPAQVCWLGNQGEEVMTYQLARSYRWQCFGEQWQLVAMCDRYGSNCHYV